MCVVSDVYLIAWSPWLKLFRSSQAATAEAVLVFVTPVSPFALADFSDNSDIFTDIISDILTG